MKLVTKAILTLLTKKYKMKKFQIKMKNLKKKLKISTLKDIKRFILPIY